MKQIVFLVVFSMLISSCEPIIMEPHFARVCFSVHNESNDTLFLSSYIQYSNKVNLYCSKNQNYSAICPNDSINSSFPFKYGEVNYWREYFEDERIDSVLLILSTARLNTRENHYCDDFLNDTSIVKVFSYTKEKALENIPARFVYPDSLESR